MQFTKKYRLTAFIFVLLLVLGVAAVAALGVAWGVEYTSGAMSSSALIRDMLICSLSAALLLFGLIALLHKATAAGAAGALTLLLNTAVWVALSMALRLEIGSWLLAVNLFVLGYSAYTALLLFRRIRENLAADQQAERHIALIADQSVRELLPRLIGPAFAVLCLAVALCALGGAGLIAFALSVVIAALVCAYSALFLVASFWAKWYASPVQQKKGADSGKKAKKKR